MVLPLSLYTNNAKHSSQHGSLWPVSPQNNILKKLNKKFWYMLLSEHVSSLYPTPLNIMS